MCGIATISIGRSSRGRIPYDKLRALTRELMVELLPRGPDASGIAVINEAGTEESWVFKKALRPDRLVVRPKFEETLSKIGPHTNFVLLHARATTVGSTEDNFNNHPIIVPNFIGIHDGTLYNDDKLFDAYKDFFPRKGEVDSEVIFRLYGHFVEQGLTPVQAMQQTTSLLQGAFTGAVIDWRHPHQMVMFKFDRTLSLVALPYYDILITVSEAKFWHRAAMKLKIKAQDRIETIFDKTGLLIDLNIEGRITGAITDFDLPVKEENRWGRRHSGWL